MKISGRIFRAILSVSAAALLAGLAAMTGVLYERYTDDIMADLKNDMELVLLGVELSGMEYLESFPARNSRVTWVAHDGSIIFDTAKAPAEMENHSDREEIALALETGSGEAARFSSTLTKQTFYYAERLSDGSVLRVSATRDGALELALYAANAAVVIFAAAVVAASLMGKNVARRLASSFERLDLEHPLENDTYDELAPLLGRIDELNRRSDRQLLELAEADGRRREFTANVSHELKTPLQSIMGSAELLENGLVKQEDMPQFFRRIRSESARLVVLIDDILRLSQLDEGRDFPKEAVDLLGVVNETADSLADIAEKAGVALVVEGRSAVVSGSYRLLCEIAYNLLENAIKYNRKGGSVKISVEPVGAAVRLVVADTGIGIPAEHQSRVFERFYRVDKSHSRESGGTGLGLSIVKHAAAYHNAKLELTSVPDRGTVVTVTFAKSS